MKDHGFTLIEVLLVVAILALLAGIATPRVFGQIEQSRVAAAMTDCSTIGKALSLSMLYDDVVPEQNDIQYLHKWPERNPWGGTYTLSSHEEYRTNQIIRLALTNVPESSYQALKAKMGDQVGRDASGIVYMYILGTGGDDIGGGGGDSGGGETPPTKPISDYDVFQYVAYAGGDIKFTADPAVNGADCVAAGTINRTGDRFISNRTDVQVPTFAALASIRHSGRPVEEQIGDYELTQNSNLQNKTLVVYGNLEVKANNDFANVTFFVTGNITLHNVNFNGAMNLIVAGGGIEALGNTNFGNSLVIAGGDMKLTNTNINGAIVAGGKIDFNGNANLNYNKGVIESSLQSN